MCEFFFGLIGESSTMEDDEDVDDDGNWTVVVKRHRRT